MAILIRATCVVLIALFLIGCEGRDRTNPLDPLNGETDGRPDWLVAVADHRAVDLTWESVPPRGFESYEIYRAGEGAGPLDLVTRIGSLRTTTYRDTGLVNDHDLQYRLDVRLTDGSVVSLPEKVARPGAAAVWVLEAASSGLVRAAPDARHLRLRTGTFGLLFDLEVPEEGGDVWAVDYYVGVLVRYDVTGKQRSAVDVSLPYRVAVDSADSLVWVGSWSGGVTSEVIVFDFGGAERARFALAAQVQDLDVDPTTGACFVAGGPLGGVTRLAIGEEPTTGAADKTVMILTVDPGRRVWTGNPISGGVAAYDTDSLSELPPPAEVDRPQCMALGEDGHLWVADRSGRILELDGAGSLQRELESFGSVTSISVEPGTQALWLAQSAKNRILRVHPDSPDETTALAVFQPFRVAIGAQTQGR